MFARLSGASLGLITVIAACSGGQTGACGAVLREAVAEDSGVHVIPTATVRYASEPPTSGPHSPGPEPGIYERVLTSPEQVGVLERGDVMVQYRPADVTAGELAGLVDGDVVLGPNPDLADPVIVTAWRARTHCSSPDTDAIGDFIRSEKDNGAPHN